MNKESTPNKDIDIKQDELNILNRQGKQKMATACEHPHKIHYSQGLCRSCYLAKYYQKRKAKNLSKE